jgi:hypothetical protein
VTVPRPLVGAWAPKTPPAAVERIRELLPKFDYAAIAKKLDKERFRTAKGLKFNMFSVGYIVRSRGWNQSAAPKSKVDV